MGSKPVSISKRVSKFLDKNPKFKLGDVQDEYESKDSEAVRSAFRRWHKKHSPPKTSKRPDHISKNGQTSDQDTTDGKQRKPSVSLSKIDEVAVEKYLCALYNLSDPKENIARLIVNWIERKGRIKVETAEKSESEEQDFMETIKRAESYVNSITEEVSP